MRTKQASKRGTRKRAVTALGVAGILSLASGTTGAAVGPASDNPTEKTAPVITLGEEEISDVSLATFYVFDKENAENKSSPFTTCPTQSLPRLQKLCSLRNLRRLRRL
jgi:hypothetical protein